MNDPRLLWWVDRSAGMTSYVLLTVALVSGVLSTGRPGVAVGVRVHSQALHRHLALVGSLLLGVHVVTAVVDSFVTLGWLDVVLPFRAGYRPVWVGLGTLALDLLLVVVVTSWLRLRMGEAAWRAVHLTTYLLWPLGTVHALGTGSDMHAAGVHLVGSVCVAAVVLAVGWRLVSASGPAWSRGLALAVVVGLVLLVSGWAVDGPLAHGWARRAVGLP